MEGRFGPTQTMQQGMGGRGAIKQEGCGKRTTVHAGRALWSMHHAMHLQCQWPMLVRVQRYKRALNYSVLVIKFKTCLKGAHTSQLTQFNVARVQ